MPLVPSIAMASDTGGRSVPSAGSDIRHEMKASAGESDDGIGSYLELDAVIPLPIETRKAEGVFLQPGLLLSREPDSRSRYGATLGMVYRFSHAKRVYGLNAFYDQNWVEDDFWDDRISHRRLSVGADYQDARNYLSTNYYFPISKDYQRFGAFAHYREYATRGYDVYHTMSVDDDWSLRSRIFYEIDTEFKKPTAFRRKGKDRVTLSSGLDYRVSCDISLGAHLEHDFLRNETAPSIALKIVLGGNGGASACRRGRTATDRARLFSVVQREKLVRTRQVVSPYRLTLLPDDVSQLFRQVSGDLASDTVWLLSQGGPAPDLSDGATINIFADDLTGPRPLVVNVHQIQTYNPGLFERMDFDHVQQVRAEMDLSVEILDRVIKHFKSQGKTVVVFSHSFGSVIVPRYLMLKGPGAADRYVIMAGRLDFPDVMVQDRLSKLHDPDSTSVYTYENDGVTLIKRETPEDVLVDGRLPLSERLGAVFQGVLGQFDYTEALADTDLSKVIYAYGTGDEALGRLTEKEVRFLESRNAHVLAVSAEGGHHGSMIDDAGARREILTLLGY